DAAQARVHALERLAHRTEQLVDGGLARLEIALGALLELAELRAREVEEGAVVPVERLPRQRLERLAQPRLARLVIRLALGRQAALSVERRLQARVRLAALRQALPRPQPDDEPRGQYPQDEPDAGSYLQRRPVHARQHPTHARVYLASA